MSDKCVSLVFSNGRSGQEVGDKLQLRSASDRDKLQTAINSVTNSPSFPYFSSFFLVSFFAWNKVDWPFRCSHVAEDSDLLHTVCTVFSSTACTHQPPGAVPWQERLVRGQEHHTDSRAHGMSASLHSKQVRMKPPTPHTHTHPHPQLSLWLHNPEVSRRQWHPPRPDSFTAGVGAVKLSQVFIQRIAVQQSNECVPGDGLPLICGFSKHHAGFFYLWDSVLMKKHVSRLNLLDPVMFLAFSKVKIFCRGIRVYYSDWVVAFSLVCGH